MEQWKCLKGIVENGDNYEVSTYGNVRSLKSNKLLKHWVDKKGYHTVGLLLDGERKCYKVHRLVATAFLPNPENKPQVNHKKGTEKWNNHIDNLEWATNLENMQHANDTGLRVNAYSKGAKNGNSKLTEQDVRKIKQLFNEKVTIRAIAKMYNVHVETISFIKRGITWKHV